MTRKVKSWQELISEYNQLYQHREFLLRLCKSLQEELHLLNNYEDTLEIKSARKQILEQEKEYNKEIAATESKMYRRKDKLFWACPPIKRRGNLELRRNITYDGHFDSGLEGTYYICLCDLGERIGKIIYRGYSKSSILCDVGYYIDTEFRGNGYAFWALCLLGEHLKENGVDEFYISTYQNNKPSLNIIKKYGSVLDREVDDAVIYKAKTFIMEKEQEEIERK